MAIFVPSAMMHAWVSDTYAVLC